MTDDQQFTENHVPAPLIYAHELHYCARGHAPAALQQLSLIKHSSDDLCDLLDGDAAVQIGRMTSQHYPIPHGLNL